MMTDAIRDADFYRAVWERIVDQKFTAKILADQVRHDGGYDMENLTESDLIRLIENRFEGSWTEPAFSFSELMAFYSVPDAIKLPEQVVGWIFGSFVIADAIRRDALDWELQLNNFLNGLMIVRNRLNDEELVRILKRVFCG